jgi:xanthine/uracil/vitamin C permease (AzgA family)
MSQPTPAARQRRAETLAKIFDLRTFIGSLFVVLGIIVAAEGLFGTSQAEIHKAAGLNLSLWTGLAMLIAGIVFISWTFLAPPQVFQGRELRDEDLPEQMRRRDEPPAPPH